jgi:hypothetical protein
MGGEEMVDTGHVGVIGIARTRKAGLKVFPSETALKGRFRFFL